MADNVPITAGSGTDIATDDVGSVHYQRVKLDGGGDGASAPILGDSANGLDVDVTRLADLEVTATTINTRNLNPTTGTATANSFISIGPLNGYSTVLFLPASNSLSIGLTLQGSLDGTTWTTIGHPAALMLASSNVSLSTTLPGGIALPYTASVNAWQYLRLSANAAVTGSASIAARASHAKRQADAMHLYANTAMVSGGVPADTNTVTHGLDTRSNVHVYNGSSWDRARGDITNGLDVDVTRVPTDPFGANADAASATGSISAKLRFIAATGIPVTGSVTTVNAGDVAHDGINSGNPVQIGVEAIAHGTNPTAVAAADRTKLYANRAGIPFVMGGHPNIVTIKHTTITTAVTDAPIITVATGLKIVVTAFTITLDNASTVFPTVLMGFGTANTPTTTGVIAAHGGVPAGGGFSRGDGSGIIGIGADGEDLRITTTGNATGNGLQVVVTYHTIES